jgi:hypothetical protein
LSGKGEGDFVAQAGNKSMWVTAEDLRVQSAPLITVPLEREANDPTAERPGR